MNKNYIGVLGGLALSVLPSCGNRLRPIVSGEYIGIDSCELFISDGYNMENENISIPTTINIGDSGLPVFAGRVPREGGEIFGSNLFDSIPIDFFDGRYDSVSVGNGSYSTTASGSVFVEGNNLNLTMEDGCNRVGNDNTSISCFSGGSLVGQVNGDPFTLGISCQGNYQRR